MEIEQSSTTQHTAYQDENLVEYSGPIIPLRVSLYELTLSEPHKYSFRRDRAAVSPPQKGNAERASDLGAETSK